MTAGAWERGVQLHLGTASHLGGVMEQRTPRFHVHFHIHTQHMANASLAVSVFFENTYADVTIQIKVLHQISIHLE